MIKKCTLFGGFRQQSYFFKVIMFSSNVKYLKEKLMTKTANDQRATVKNPNNLQHTQNQINRTNQLNPNHKPTKSK